MVYSKDLKKFLLTDENFYVLIDFDETITSSNSMNSWSVLENPDLMGPIFPKKSLELVEKYYPYELDHSISKEEKAIFMDEWYQKNMDLLYDFGLTHSILFDCMKAGNLKFRDGCKEFLSQMYQKQIPVIILSAGIGNVITEFLRMNDCLYSNIFIQSNFIQFENNKMKKFSDQMIHSSNKCFNRLPNKIRQKVVEKDYVVLLGDLIEDIDMARKEDLDNTLSFGFLKHREKEKIQHYLDAFSVVLTDKSSFYDVISILKLLKKED